VFSYIKKKPGDSPFPASTATMIEFHRSFPFFFRLSTPLLGTETCVAVIWARDPTFELD